MGNRFSQKALQKNSVLSHKKDNKTFKVVWWFEYTWPVGCGAVRRCCFVGVAVACWRKYITVGVGLSSAQVRRDLKEANLLLLGIKM